MKMNYFFWYNSHGGLLKVFRGSACLSGIVVLVLMNLTFVLLQGPIRLLPDILLWTSRVHIG